MLVTEYGLALLYLHQHRQAHSDDDHDVEHELVGEPVVEGVLFQRTQRQLVLQGHPAHRAYLVADLSSDVGGLAALDLIKILRKIIRHFIFDSFHHVAVL